MLFCSSEHILEAVAFSSLAIYAFHQRRTCRMDFDPDTLLKPAFKIQGPTFSLLNLSALIYMCHSCSSESAIFTCFVTV